jgi:hypothetical protein
VRNADFGLRSAGCGFRQLTRRVALIPCRVDQASPPNKLSFRLSEWNERMEKSPELYERRGVWSGPRVRNADFGLRISDCGARDAASDSSRHASPGSPAVSPKRAFPLPVISTKRAERAHGEIPGVERASWSLERTTTLVPVVVFVPTALEARLDDTRRTYSSGDVSTPQASAARRPVPLDMTGWEGAARRPAPLDMTRRGEG